MTNTPASFAAPISAVEGMLSDLGDIVCRGSVGSYVGFGFGGRRWAGAVDGRSMNPRWVGRARKWRLGGRIGDSGAGQACEGGTRTDPPDT